MTPFFKKNIFLIFIFFLAFFIRIYSIHTTPLLWDEASLGYNAYSILKTGRDEYGTFESWKLINVPIDNNNINCDKLVGKKLTIEIK